jgi:hypothetical protein
VIQGLLRRRRNAVALASKTGADGLAFGFMSALKRSCGEGPMWIRLAKDEALLLFGRNPIRQALETKPGPRRRGSRAEALGDGEVPARRADDLTRGARSL